MSDASLSRLRKFSCTDLHGQEGKVVFVPLCIPATINIGLFNFTTKYPMKMVFQEMSSFFFLFEIVLKQKKIIYFYCGFDERKYVIVSTQQLVHWKSMASIHPQPYNQVI